MARSSDLKATFAALVLGAALPLGAAAEGLPTDAAGFDRCAGDASCEAACYADRACLDRMTKWIDSEIARLRAEAQDHVRAAYGPAALRMRPGSARR